MEIAVARREAARPARQTHTECLHRELQRQVPRRLPQRKLGHLTGARHGDDRCLATRLQWTTPAQLARQEHSGRVRRPAPRAGVPCNHEPGRYDRNHVVYEVDLRPVVGGRARKGEMTHLQNRWNCQPTVYGYASDCALLNCRSWLLRGAGRRSRHKVPVVLGGTLSTLDGNTGPDPSWPAATSMRAMSQL